jgi:hypothetical protein|tara:strand:- start:487 stop:627 length:141 start_codon:yes stop_codon:yes gene_type:complete
MKEWELASQSVRMVEQDDFTTQKADVSAVGITRVAWGFALYAALYE